VDLDIHSAKLKRGSISVSLSDIALMELLRAIKLPNLLMFLYVPQHLICCLHAVEHFQHFPKIKGATVLTISQ